MLREIEKRDGRKVEFSSDKIQNAIYRAMKDVRDEKSIDLELVSSLTADVNSILEEEFFTKEKVPHVEQIQDTIEKLLIKRNLPDIAKSYILYRDNRSRIREMKGELMKIYEDLTFKDSKDSDLKRENGNISGDEPMAVMLRYGSEGAKRYNELCVLKPEHSRAHLSGDIHIHDLDFLTLTTTCCQIDVGKLLRNGFNTGHGTIRSPKSIRAAMSLAAVILQANQNQQHGGQAIPAFDYYLAPYVSMSFAKSYKSNIRKAIELIFGSRAGSFIEEYDKLSVNEPLTLSNIDKYTEAELDMLSGDAAIISNFKKCQDFAREHALKETEDETYQASEAFIHNMNSLHSRSGGQVVFSSINFGTDTSPEGRMVTKNILLATDAGMGNGETPIFPISIFKLKDGINYKETDPNYDLFELACRVSAKRLFPNFSNIDAPYNLALYKEGDPDTEIAYMGCRTRVAANVYDPSKQIVTGRGNLSFTTINLPRLAILADHDIDKFFKMLDEKIDLVNDQLLDRFKIQCKRHVYNYKFLMGQHIWLDSEKLGPNDEVGEVLKHGTLTCGFIGLAEALVALIGKHHGESDEAQELGLKIIQHMRDRMDETAQKYKLNFSLIATPAESTAGRLVRLDQAKFGKIPGVTDREYYTNSFHVPVYYNITAYEKIKKEAPYHEKCNGGAISYIELDGDPTQNIDAFKHVVKAMKESGMGYFALNHAIDTDPICGFSGVINDICPGCGRREKDGGPAIIRLRRITGYLVGSVEEGFNNAKKAEERDRVKHQA